MAKLTIYGASDDLIEMSGDGVDFLDESPGSNQAEYQAYGTGDKPNEAYRTGDKPNEAYIVANAYADDETKVVLIKGYYTGTWGFAVHATDETQPIPNDWTITVSQATECDYSSQITIETPEPIMVYAVGKD